MTRVKKESDLDAVREEIDRTIEKYQHLPVDPKKLDDLKKRLKYDFVMDLSTADRVAGALARYIALSGGIEAVDTLYDLYESITPAEIQQAAAAFLVREHRTVVTLTGGQK
jgi:predicted Zn-dependent peptidase